MLVESAKTTEKPKSGNLFPLTLPRDASFLLIYQELAALSAMTRRTPRKPLRDPLGAISVPKICTF
jgi:hypothetical protein